MIQPHPVTITVLVENTTARHDLRAEHGLSFWIEWGGHHVLFDTGQSAAFSENARRMGIDLSKTQAIALSHGHYDHTGGLAEARRHAPGARVFFHPDALGRKYTRHAGVAVREIGMPPASERALRDHPRDCVHTRTPTEIFDGLYVSGAIPRVNDFEDTGGSFFIDSQAFQADPLLDDQAIYFQTARGIVILLGCAHAGVINTVAYIQSLCGGAEVRAVIGGMHLLNASEDRLGATIQSLRRHPSLLLAPTHCSGREQTARLRREFSVRCLDCRAGSCFAFE